MILPDLQSRFVELSDEMGLETMEKKILDPGDAPKPRPWWMKFVERKFLLPLLLVTAMIVGVATGSIPFGWEVIAGVVALVWSWIRGEVKLDLARMHIPDVPGWGDDFVRAIQQLVLFLEEERQLPRSDPPS